MKKYILEAHRGVALHYPENTMSAFRAASELGYGMIELDTKFTADDACVILHDRTVNRTGRLPDGSAIKEETPINSLTFDEAQKFDYGIFLNEKFRGEPLPRLEEALKFALEAKIPLKFDNVLFSHTPAQRKQFFDTILQFGMGELAQITCASLETVNETLTHIPDAQIHYDGAAEAAALEALAAILPPQRLTVWLRFDNRHTSWNKNPPVSQTLAAKVKKVGKLGVWLLTEESERRRALDEFGADIIETDGSLLP